MLQTLLHPKEKKVEYVELIYDLIFVYVIGRNNHLLRSFEDGFVAAPAFLAYIMTTLAIIQIWNFTTYYVNIYGRHSVRDHMRRRRISCPKGISCAKHISPVPARHGYH